MADLDLKEPANAIPFLEGLLQQRPQAVYVIAFLPNGSMTRAQFGSLPPMLLSWAAEYMKQDALQTNAQIDAAIRLGLAAPKDKP